MANITDYLMNDTNYISAGDGEIYINNVLVDECYDLQYSYKEMKEPVYGYRSKYYSSVLPGTVLISGQFTINYIHDAYLYALLNAGNPTQVQLDTTKLTTKLTTGLDKKNLLQQYNYLRKEIELRTAEINSINSKIAVLNSSALAAKQAQELLVKNTTAQLDNEEKNIENWKKQMLFGNSEERYQEAYRKLQVYNSALAEYNNLNKLVSSDSLFDNAQELNISYSDSLLEELSNKLNEYNATGDSTKEESVRRDIYDIVQRYKSEIDNMLDPTYFDQGVPINTDVKTLYDFNNNKAAINNNYITQKLELNSFQSAIDERKEQLSKKLTELSKLNTEFLKLKTQLGKSNTPSNYISKSGNYKTFDSINFFADNTDITGLLGTKDSRVRPEDINREISITFKYNGTIHKVLTGIKLLGHSHMIGVGGQPIQETYIFLAKTIENK